MVAHHQSTAYHASQEDLGDRVTFDRGGYYEQVDDLGCPVARRAAGNFCGWEQSDTPELAASKSPEGAVFAQVYNVGTALPAGGYGAGSVPVTVYQLDERPDVDLSGTLAGDFSITEEVRYRRPEQTPVTGNRMWQVDVPEQIVTDVMLAYLPPSPHVISEWATAVRDAIGEWLRDGAYAPDGPRPSADGYRQACFRSRH